MAVNMLAAYYGCGEDTDALFRPLQVNTDPTYFEYLNQFHVLQINMQNFLSESDDVNQMISALKNDICLDLTEAYPDIRYRDRHNLCRVMQEVY